jgi:hypothetical protein
MFTEGRLHETITGTEHSARRALRLVVLKLFMSETPLATHNTLKGPSSLHI